MSDESDECTTAEDTASLRREPDADYDAIQSAMHELIAAVAPLMELTSPPSWTIALGLVMNVALRDIEEKRLEVATNV